MHTYREARWTARSVQGIVAAKVEAHDGGVVMGKLDIGSSTDAIVLLDPDHRPPEVIAWRPLPDVLRVTSGGDVVWRSALMPEETTAKCWLTLESSGDRFRARTYSYECDVDPESGQIARKTFTR